MQEKALLALNFFSNDLWKMYSNFILKFNVSCIHMTLIPEFQMYNFTKSNADNCAFEMSTVRQDCQKLVYIEWCWGQTQICSKLKTLLKIRRNMWTVQVITLYLLSSYEFSNLEVICFFWEYACSSCKSITWSPDVLHQHFTTLA